MAFRVPYKFHVVDTLIDDHRFILEAVDLLEKAGKLLEEGRVEPRVIARLVWFLEEFGDKCHHTKEEVALFPCMEARGYKKRDAIERLVCEHGVARYMARRILDSLERLDPGDREAVGRVSGYIRKYVEFMRRHIDVEDLEVFEDARSIIDHEENVDKALEVDKKTGKDKLIEELYRIRDQILNA